MTYISEPKIFKPLEFLISTVEKRIGKKMMPARLLLWTPKAFISSMILEGLISHKKGAISDRMLKLIRMQVSLLVACPFCIDMNSSEFRRYGITEEEIKGLQRVEKLVNIKSFSNQERLVLTYIRGLVRTPIKQNPKVIARMTQVFTEKEFATIVTTIAQVDYWTRIIQGFGIQPAGFLESCDLKVLYQTE